jgi:hypothetical protein
MSPGDRGGVVRERLRDGGELVEHRLHQVRVERVRDGQPLHAHALGAQPLLQARDGLGVAGDGDGGGAVDGRQVHALGQLQPVLGGLDGQHRAALGQRVHQPAARRHQPARVVQGQHPGAVRGGQLTDGVAHQHVRGHPPRLHQAEQRHLDGEQGGLRVHGPVQRLGVVAEDHVAQRPLEVHPRAHRVERLREDGERVVQFTPHPDPLRALAGEQEPGPALAHRAGGDPVRGFGGGQGREAGREVGRGAAGDHRAVVEGLPGGGQ